MEAFARVESEDTGKPYEFLSLGGDLPFCVDNLRFFSAAVRDTHGHHAGEYMPGYTSIYRREPVGVVGQIAPWNYPLLMAVWKLGPALAAGCTAVLKPATITPRTPALLAELSAQAGMPAGVVNVITGNVGPNAHKVLAAAGISIFQAGNGLTAREALRSWNAQELTPAKAPTVAGHWS